MSKTRAMLVTSAALVAIVGLAAPVHAQRRQGGRDGGSGQARVAQQRAGQPQRQSAPPARATREAQPQAQRQAQPQAGRRPVSPAPARIPEARADRSTPVRPNDAGRAVPRQQAVPRSLDNRGGATRYTYGSRDGYAPRGSYQPRVVTPYRSYGSRSYAVRRPIFVQRYYSFRPHFSIGFGLSVGYGVAYPFRYDDPNAFYNYGIGVLPYGAGYNNYYSRVGGISFDIYPYDAAVFIDGQYVGVADDFSPEQMPLTLRVGRHHIDLEADGFLTASFDITIVGGQVIPYQGTLAGLR